MFSARGTMHSWTALEASLLVVFSAKFVLVCRTTAPRGGAPAAQRTTKHAHGKRGACWRQQGPHLHIPFGVWCVEHGACTREETNGGWGRSCGCAQAWDDARGPYGVAARRDIVIHSRFVAIERVARFRRLAGKESVQPQTAFLERLRQSVTPHRLRKGLPFMHALIHAPAVRVFCSNRAVKATEFRDVTRLTASIFHGL